MNDLFIDFETFYDTKEKYDLKTLSILEYIKDLRFHVYGAAVSDDDGKKPRWLTASALKTYFTAVDWKNTRLIAHNIKFDGAIVAWIYGRTPRVYADTQAMARAVLAHRIPSVSLRTLAEFYNLSAKGQLLGDGHQFLTPSEEISLSDYCIQDTILLREIYTRLRPLLPWDEDWHIDWVTRAFIDPIFKLDGRQLQEDLKTVIQNQEAAIQASGLSKTTLASSQKFTAALCAMGYKPPKKISSTTQKEIPAFAKKDVEFASFKREHGKELDTVLAARAAATSRILPTRLQALSAISKYGIYPFDMIYSGAHTHRYSGGSDAGKNPQNFPRGRMIRDAIGPLDPAMSVIVGDFSQIELRINAMVAQDKTLIGVFKAGISPYCDFGAAFYKRPITKADVFAYQFSKCAVLGLGYQMGATHFQEVASLATNSDFSFIVAQEAVDLFRGRYRGLPAWWAYLQNVIIPFLLQGKTGVGFGPHEIFGLEKERIVLPGGLSLHYPGIQIVDGEAVYFPYRHKKIKKVKLYGGALQENLCQALTQVILKEKIRLFEEAGFRIGGQVHDEWIGVVPKHEATGALETMRKIVTMGVAWLPELCLDAEINTGPTWADAKP